MPAQWHRRFVAVVERDERCAIVRKPDCLRERVAVSALNSDLAPTQRLDAGVRLPLETSCSWNSLLIQGIARPLEFQGEFPLRGVQGLRSLGLALQFSADAVEFQREFLLRRVQGLRSLALALQFSADAVEFQRKFLPRRVQGLRLARSRAAAACGHA